MLKMHAIIGRNGHFKICQMSLKFCFISTNMPNSKQVFSEQGKALYSSIFLPDFSLITNISALQLFLNQNFNLLNPVGRVFYFTRKQLFFFKCKYYLSGRILPGKFCLKCEYFRKLQITEILKSLIRINILYQQ